MTFGVMASSCLNLNEWDQRATVAGWDGIISVVMGATFPALL
jgi:hypothetical protein